VGAVIFRQIIHDDLGCASYLVGDGDAATAAVVDPRFEIEEYLDLARYLGVRIEHVLETHTHADHVSGTAAGRDDRRHHPRPSGRRGRVPPRAVRARVELALGSCGCARSTPRSRPEHTAFALIDTARGEQPWAVLTGDSLFVGDVARPDLAVDREEGARALYRSLTSGILDLPSETEVWPGHLGGSMCGGPDMDQKISSTVGFELRHNPLLSEAGEDGFVARALAGLGPSPALRGHRGHQPRPAADRRGPRRAAVGGPGRAPGRGAPWSWTSAPTCSSPRPTCWAPSSSRTCARASAPSSHGWRGPTSRSSSSAATTPTACARPASPSRSASAPSRATSPGA
jgi:glyoxylase-like metal-dependent hydrolase (beta-lactamase superfamily II)